MNKPDGVYQGEWDRYEDMERDTSYGTQLPKPSQIIYAAYDVDGYEGSSLLLYEEDGTLMVNHDSHCSCMGLEDWHPEITSVEAELMTPDVPGEYGYWPQLHEAVVAWWMHREPAQVLEVLTQMNPVDEEC